MKLFVCDSFTFPLTSDHRFPAAKYALTRQRIDESGLFAREDLIVPHAATDEELLRVHTSEYLHTLTTGSLSAAEQRRIGLPWSPELIERARRTTGATIEAARAALSDGIAVNLAGGTHHAFADAGEGFCLLNDCAVAARAMQAEGRAERILIVDLDVHQGNGTARIFQGDDRVFTFSVHGAKNFPARKELSDLDLELPDDTRDEQYLDAVERGLFESIHRARADLVFYLAGVDPYERDRLGRMKVTKAGLAQRNEIVFAACHAARLPVVVTMAGGYSEPIEDTADLYFQNAVQALSCANRFAQGQ